MSTRRGGETSRVPAHQNKFAFRHNKNSKKTAKIAAMPIYCDTPLPHSSHSGLWTLQEKDRMEKEVS